MDKNTKHLIKKFYEKYCLRTFDQVDVAFFIVTIRDYTVKNSIFRELGDFIAHPKLKDRGLIITTIQPTLDFIDENYVNMLKGVRPNIKVPYGLATLDEIVNSLIDIFKVISANIEIDRNDISFREFIFCLVFLLGNYKIKLNDRIFEFVIYSGQSLKLTVLYNPIINVRHYYELDILFLGNIYIEPLSFDRRKIENHIVRRTNNGYLVALPYEYDTDEILNLSKNLPRNQYFPIFFY